MRYAQKAKKSCTECVGARSRALGDGRSIKHSEMCGMKPGRGAAEERSGKRLRDVVNGLLMDGSDALLYRPKRADGRERENVTVERKANADGCAVTNLK